MSFYVYSLLCIALIYFAYNLSEETFNIPVMFCI
jgi:hypothetical protein